MSKPTRPVCVTHGVEMVCERNASRVLFSASFGPYEVHVGDQYVCPVGEERIVLGWAEKALAQHWQDGFDDYAKTAQVQVGAR